MRLCTVSPDTYTHKENDMTFAFGFCAAVFVASAVGLLLCAIEAIVRHVGGDKW